MSNKRHHSHQGGTTPTTEPQHSSGVAQFSVSEVAQFSVSLDNNFGFAISAGKLTQKTSLLIDLISYCYQHKQMPTAQFGPPRIFYLDICFFPSSRVDEYRTFVSRLPEIQDCMASS